MYLMGLMGHLCLHKMTLGTLNAEALWLGEKHFRCLFPAGCESKFGGNPPKIYFVVTSFRGSHHFWVQFKIYFGKGRAEITTKIANKQIFHLFFYIFIKKNTKNSM